MSGLSKTSLHSVERRPTPRRRVLLSALVCYSQGAESFGCTIRDLSESGARITLPGNREVPSQIFLIKIRDRVAYEANIVWRSDKEAGVTFLKSIPLVGLTDPCLSFLSKLWLAAVVP